MKEKLRTVARWLLGVTYVALGANHFLNPDFYVAIMPPQLPWHLELVWLSGAAEIALGLLALPKATMRLAGWLLVALLVAVFPANIHMALHPEDFDVPAWGAYLRLPFQALFIAWALWATHPPRDAA